MRILELLRQKKCQIKPTHHPKSTELNEPQWGLTTISKGGASGETGSGRRPVIRSLATGCHCCLPKGSPQNTCVTAKIVAVGNSFAGTIPHS